LVSWSSNVGLFWNYYYYNCLDSWVDVSLPLDDFHKDLYGFIFFLKYLLTIFFAIGYQGYCDVACKSITIVWQQCFGTNFAIMDFMLNFLDLDVDCDTNVYNDDFVNDVTK
jgi:hypothetical protein